MNKKIFLVLLAFSFISFFLSFYKHSSVPACINADEAAFGYNSYSILKTGKDEYGNKFPLRLKSFGDYKMPLYSYLSLPIIGLLGLNDLSVRLLNNFIVLLFPFAIFLLAREIFQETSVAVLSAFFVSTSVGLLIVGRQAHEAYIAAFLITITSLFFLRILNKKTGVIDSLLFFSTLFISLFSYQSSRIFALFFLILSIYYVIKKRVTKKFLFGLLTIISIFAITDVIYKPDRVTSLFFFNTRGFSDKINELRAEGGNRIIYNKLSISIQTITNEHLKYYSPEFLLIRGDTNHRFGFPDLALLTYLEYGAIIVGLYYLFKRKHHGRYFLILLLLISPLSGSPTKVDTSLTRALFLFIPLYIIAAYGIISIIERIDKKYIFVSIITLTLLELFGLTYSWDFYFNHYPKRAIMVREWQCGYKEIAHYIKENYNKYDKFYITQRNGQPYIFILYFLNYPPEKYQTQALLTAPDQYGFGQIKKFDKYVFDVPRSIDEPHTVIIGYPDEFTNKVFDRRKIKEIKIGTEKVFWIYENPTIR